MLAKATVTMMTKSYEELSKLTTFEERFRYLKLDGVVGAETFGSDRYLNQILYQDSSSSGWRSVRRKVILRDNGNDLGCDDRPINGRVIVHHLNPISKEDILNRDPKIFDLNNLICVSHNTHLAIHYGSEDLLMKDPIERKPNDTCPWKR